MNNQIKWDKRFLELAKHISQWSKDPSTKVGAVITNDQNRILSVGYNGFPRGVADNSDRYCNKQTKYAMVVHAELNAILNSAHNLEGSTIYVYPTLMNPGCCNECAKAIIQSGVTRIVTYQKDIEDSIWKSQQSISAVMLNEAGIKIDNIGE